MEGSGADFDDSQARAGGEIPGSGGLPAFTLSVGKSSLPILIAAPHGGRRYPPAVLDRMRHPGSAALRLEDRYVDRIAQDVARRTGAALLVAHAPRAMIDLNRGSDDVDWTMFGRPPDLGCYTPGRRARSGLGLIPRRLPGLGELWTRRHEETDLAARIAGIHQPYHECLGSALSLLRARWGAALLLDLHSMPPLGTRAGQSGPEFVVGDRFGTTCNGKLIGTTFAYFAEMRRSAAHNRPYAGGHVLERHAAPAKNLHAFQLEIDRSSYLDPALRELGAGYSDIVEVLAGLVTRLASDVAELGGCEGLDPWSEAAE